jgi:hypothetical protein
LANQEYESLSADKTKLEEQARQSWYLDFIVTSCTQFSTTIEPLFCAQILVCKEAQRHERAQANFTSKGRG